MNRSAPRDPVPSRSGTAGAKGKRAPVTEATDGTAAASLSAEFVRDAAAIHRRAMQSLFDRLDSLCDGAIAVDPQARVVWVNDKYVATLGLDRAEAAIGKDVEEVIPNSLMRQVVETGQPILLDIMMLGKRPLVVTRMPLEDEHGAVIGALG